MLPNILERIQHEIITYHNYSKNDTNEYDVVFSCLFHESPDCYFDNLLNILWASRGLKIKIIISMTDSLYNEIKQQQTITFNDSDSQNNSLIHINSIRPATLPVWGNVNLFEEHMKNLKYLIDSQTNFTYFMFMSSNQLFIRPLSIDYLDRLVPKTISLKPLLSNDDYIEQYNKADTHPTLAHWTWWYNAKLDSNFVAFIRKYQIIPQQGTVDGFCVRREHIIEVYHVYKENKLHENCTYGGYVMEEILVRSYIGSKYNLSCNFYACNLHLQWQIQYAYPEYNKLNSDQIYELFINNNIFKDTLTIKPIHRNLNDPLRTKIRVNHHLKC